MGNTKPFNSRKQIRGNLAIGLLLALALLGGLARGSVSAAGDPSETRTPGPAATKIATITPTPTITLTPGVQQDAEPQAWLDAAQDLEQFPANGKLLVHFNTPMSAQSSLNPVLVWPGPQGVSSWDESFTTLSFTPAAILDSKKSYTFFLDPLLRSATGKALKQAPQWIAHAPSGPKVLSVSPAAGPLASRWDMIEVSFDRPMSSADPQKAFSIEPKTALEIKWKSSQVLQIIPQQPLIYGQRYDLSIRGGANGLLDAAGAPLADDFNWFYAQAPLEVSTYLTDASTLAVNFNYSLDQAKNTALFSITPALAGEWKWLSLHEATFHASTPIPAARQYTLAFSAPLVDDNGAQLTTPAQATFSGLAPLRLLEQGLERNKYDQILYAHDDLSYIFIEFDLPVKHAAAEKAFSLLPPASGKFQWQKASSGQGEVLVYALNDLLAPASYTVKIDPALRDIHDQPVIAQAYQQTFEVSGWNYTRPSFGESGDNIQVLDASGARKLQFADAGAAADKDTIFAAYRFELIDYAALYAGHYKSRSGNNIRDIPIPVGAKPVSTWSNISRRKIEDNEVAETSIPAELAPGLYILNLRYQERMYDQIFLVVTRNTLVVKNNGAELFVWLTDINGKNVPEAEIRVYSEDGAKIREGKTDENGQYRVSIPSGQTPMLVSASLRAKGQPEDVTLAGFKGWSSYFSSDYNGYGSYWYYPPESQATLIYLYTERPVYRPGQTVNFKAILRKDNDVRYSLLPEGTPLKLRLLDARGNILQRLELSSNRFGSANGSVVIAEGAVLGDYTLEAEVEGVSANISFKVEDYRKPDYQITLTSLQPEKNAKFVRDEDVKMQINVAYYFGEPLANASLEVKFYHYGEVTTSISGDLVTDAKGNATITFPTPFDQDNYAWMDTQNIRMEVTANDGSNQTVTGVYHFSVYPASEKISLDTGGYYLQPDQPFTASIRVVDLFDKPVAGRSLSMSLSSWNRDTYELNDTGKKFTFTTGANGLARQDLKLGAGFHQLLLSAEDAQGHLMEVRRWVYVFKDKNDWFQRSKDGQLQISAEKDSYKPGEKARFAIESSFSGPALLSFERGSVINTKMVELTAPLTIVESDIIPEHAPNVYVTVNAWQPAAADVHRGSYWYYSETEADAYLRLAKTEIQVDASAKALDISIQTDKQSYAPREKVSAIIQVKDAAGQPVLAELSLAVVDESIFALASDNAVDIFTAFYGPRAHTVNTFDSLAPLRLIMSPQNGGGGGGESPSPARTDFPDTSAWLPTIVTDANGRATISFELPDSTTSWRLSVKAVTLKHQVGQAQANITTKKDVFVSPVLPRVLTSGDQADLTAFIHNYGDSARTLTVNFTAAGLELQSPNDEQFTLQPGEVRAARWRVLVSGAKTTDVTISVSGPEGLLDAVRLPLQLQPAAVKDVQNQAGEFSGSLSLSLPLPNIQRDTSQAHLSLNRSMSGTLLNGLEYLTGYPYGCVEQTMSRALPNAVVLRAATQLGAGGPEMQTRLDPLIRASVQKLYGLQHNDGGWGWWTDDESDAYETAWVLFGLSVMRDSGVSIEPKVLDNAAKWLSSAINNRDADPRTRAYALYSLALSGHGDLPATQALVSTSLKELDPFSQAALALALKRLGKSEQAAGILQSLSQSALSTGDQLYWPQPNDDGEYHRKTMASSLRTTAFILLAYTEIDPHNPLLPGVVRYLAAQRQGLNGWGSTNETSFTILALTGYLVNQEKEPGKTPYEVLLNGKSLFSGTLEPGNTSAGLDLPMTALQPGLNTLLVTSQGGQKLYYDLSTHYDLLQTRVQPAGSIQVTRRYLDPTSGDVLQSIQAGQLVKVELTVKLPASASFLAVEDYLPGGLEALNEGLSAINEISYDMWGYENYWDNRYFWKDYGYNYKEIRGDRVVFFITSLDEDTRTFSYYARATTPGQFTALPAQAYTMYDASLWGRSDMREVVVLGRK